VTVIKYRALFRKLYDRLAGHPDSGPLRPALGPDIRIGVVSPYIVIYRHTEAADTVTILRIVHGRRRITGTLLSG
jgi:toxin ParE1/3/4